LAKWGGIGKWIPGTGKNALPCHLTLVGGEHSRFQDKRNLLYNPGKNLDLEEVYERSKRGSISCKEDPPWKLDKTHDKGPSREGKKKKGGGYWGDGRLKKVASWGFKKGGIM